MNKTGRKATAVNEITDRNFTIVDLININTNVKAPTIRMHVKRSVTAGRYKISGSQKTGKRGKPSIVYTYDIFIFKSSIWESHSKIVVHATKEIGATNQIKRLTRSGKPLT